MIALSTDYSSHVSDIVKIWKLFVVTEWGSSIKCSLDFNERIFRWAILTFNFVLLGKLIFAFVDVYNKLVKVGPCCGWISPLKMFSSIEGLNELYHYLNTVGIMSSLEIGVDLERKTPKEHVCSFLQVRFNVVPLGFHHELYRLLT